jgi:hypothetical protein
MSDSRFGSWSVAESPVTIEYSVVVIEEIRHEVAEGLQKLARGGVEVGGILYGVREGRTVRIMAIRPIVCEHARGPAFLLSASDRQILDEQLEHELEDPRLADMICLGWFLSHTRSEIVLTESDLEIYDKHFGAPWQVTLVIRPGRGGSMRAGFFVREHDGAVRSDASYLEFNFPDRLAGVLDRPPRGERPAVERRPGPYFRESNPSAIARRDSTPPAPALAGPQLLPAPPPRSKWPWLVAWGVVVLALVIVGLRYFVQIPHADPLALTLAEHGGQLQIEWNHSARPVTTAVRGSLSITDGKAARTIPLTPRDLEHGAYTYVRVSDDVEVRMGVENARGEKAEETTTFLGAAPVKSDSDEKSKASEQDLADRQTEIDRLKHENSTQAARIQELERNLKILQSRLGQQ